MEQATYIIGKRSGGTTSTRRSRIRLQSRIIAIIIIIHQHHHHSSCCSEMQCGRTSSAPPLQAMQMS